jgi:hypothetical protein
MLDTIIAKANNIFKRWYHGQDVPTLVLRHEGTFVDQLMKLGSHTSSFAPAPSPPPTDDSFKNAHPTLLQCVAEGYERAKMVLPMRKPCQCSKSDPSASCPPSHSWEPPPQMDLSKPVLPPLYPEIANPLGFSDSPVTLSTASPYYAGIDSVNFELGALQTDTEQGWMVWF